MSTAERGSPAGGGATDVPGAGAGGAAGTASDASGGSSAGGAAAGGSSAGSTAGAGGEDAGPALACTPTGSATTSSPVIDDFEDGNLTIKYVDGRSGSWLRAGDNLGTFESTSLATTTGGHEDSLCLSTKATGFTSWGSFVKFDFRPGPQPYDVSVFGGISFWAKGSGSVRVKAASTETTLVDYGGACTSGCNDHYATWIDLGATWTQHTVRFAELRQDGWGTQVPLALECLLGIEFSSGTDYELYLDDVTFVP